MARLLISATVVSIALGLFGYSQWSRPRLYKQCSSPDKAWSVRVFRSHGVLSVPVTVEVVSGNDSPYFIDVIDARDTWNDVEDRYPDLDCDVNSARIGPGYWNGKESGYFQIPVPNRK
jgi:hypothetical protein